MKRLMIDEANRVYRLAQEDKRRCVSSNIRMGQALMNNLPLELYQEVTGTELDMFHFKDDHVAVEFFFNNFVEGNN